MVTQHPNEDEIPGFGRHSGTDYNMLINIVYILIGFMISTTEGFLGERSDDIKRQLEQIPTLNTDNKYAIYNIIERLVIYSSPVAQTWMFLTGSAVLICFLFYLAEYYEKIWVDFFIQHKDKLFFRFYCILIAIYVIILKLFPVFWPLFFSLLVSFLIKKKWSTRKNIREAIDAIYPKNTRPKRMQAIYVLADTMAYNFTLLGFASLTVFMLTTYAAFQYQLLWMLILFSLFCICICLFWLRKIQSGIDGIRNHINAGDISDAAFVRVFS